VISNGGELLQQRRKSSSFYIAILNINSYS